MNEPREWRPSTGLGAVALALFITGVVSLLDQGRGTLRRPEWYAVLFSATAGGVLTAIHLGAAAVRGYLAVSERRAILRDAWNKVLGAPVALVPAEPEPPAAPDDRGWYLATEITLFAGQVAGFTDTGLEPIMGSDARPAMQHFLEERGVLALTATGYGWAEGVTLADALRRLRLDDLAPYPDGPAPKVRPPVQPATRRSAPRRAAKVAE